MTHFRKLIAIHSLVLLQFSPVLAMRVSSRHLRYFTIQAEAIAVVDVVSVEVQASGQDVARGKVLEAWKGTVGSELRFVVPKGRACNSMRAQVGDTFLLFLEQANQAPIFHLLNGVDGAFHIVKNSEGQFVLRRNAGAMEPPTIEVSAFGTKVPGTPLSEVREFVLGQMRESRRREN